MFQILFSGVSQGFILGPEQLNFAHSNTIVTFWNSVNDLITELQNETENVTKWK